MCIAASSGVNWGLIKSDASFFQFQIEIKSCQELESIEQNSSIHLKYVLTLHRISIFIASEY